MIISNISELVKGKQYLVKHRGGKQQVRRIYKGEEEGVLGMKRVVFSSRVKARAYAELEVEMKDGKETGIVFWHWKNTPIPRKVISIPSYDLESIFEVTEIVVSF